MPSSPSDLGTLLAARIGDLAWMRLEGRGDHRLAPTFKRWALHELKKGVETLVLDLDACEGLDSTFLGTIATLIFESQKSNSHLILVRANERCFRILDRMGMNQLTTVKTDLGDYAKEGEPLSRALTEYQTHRALSQTERTRFALEAHRELQKTSTENRLRFTDVVDLLEEDLRNQENPG